MFIAMYKHAQTQLNTSDRAKYQAESQGLLGWISFREIVFNFCPIYYKDKKKSWPYTMISH